MDVTMFQMNFGESILLGDDNSCLLVDCGSKSSLKPNTQMFQNVQNAVAQYSHKDAVISHFHDDHYKGFRNFNHIFDCVYIPHIFTSTQHPNMVDYMLMRHYLQSRLRGKKNQKFTLLQLVEDMLKIGKTFTLRKRGDTLQFGSNQAEVLWPCPKTINREIQNTGIFSMVSGEFSRVLYNVSDKISELFLWGRDGESVLLTDNVAGTAEQLSIQVDELTRWDYEAVVRNPNYRDVLITQFRWKLPQYINDHTYCIVFQIKSASDQKKFLFTGDVQENYLRMIVDNFDGIIPMWTEFYAVKAPHHGTDNYYCTDLFQSHISIEIIFISHGTGYGNYGKIASGYINQPYDLICTNYQYAECPQYQKCTSRICGLYLNPLLPWYPI